MKHRYFLLIPINPAEAPSFFSISERRWNQTISDLYPMLGCKLAERFKARLGPGGRIAYCWVDEEGHVYRRPLNPRASGKLYPGLIAGPVAVELGAFDLESPEDAAKWDKLMARIGPDLRQYGIEIPDKVEVQS